MKTTSQPMHCLLIITQSLLMASLALEMSTSTDDHHPYRQLGSQNLSQSNYSDQIIDDNQLICQPMNCEMNCCNHDNICPMHQDDCKFSRCDDSMCSDNGGCCILGVCRSSSQCKTSKIARLISIGIVVILVSGIAYFKGKIQYFVQDKQLYSQEEEVLGRLQRNLAKENYKYNLQGYEGQLKHLKGQQFPPVLKSSGSQLKFGDEANSHAFVHSISYINNINNHQFQQQQQQNLNIPQNLPLLLHNPSSIAHVVPDGVAEVYQTKTF